MVSVELDSVFPFSLPALEMNLFASAFTTLYVGLTLEQYYSSRG